MTLHRSRLDLTMMVLYSCRERETERERREERRDRGGEREGREERRDRGGGERVEGREREEEKEGKRERVCV